MTTKTKKHTAEQPAADFQHDAMVIRTVNAADRSHGEFQWPVSVGEDGVKPGKTYRLGSDGKPVEVGK